MRTVRTKVYKFNELSKDAQAIAIVSEAIRFNLSISGRTKKEFNHHEIDAAREQIINRKYEFTREGKQYY